jgi:hypothetical protein
MRSLDEIREKFDALVLQRDALTNGSAARRLANHRVMALGWVLEHPKVPDLLLSKDTVDLLDCLS